MLAEHKSINFILRRLKIKERQNPNIMVKTTISSALQPERKGVGKTRQLEEVEDTEAGSTSNT